MILSFKTSKYLDAAMLYDYMRDISIALNLKEEFFMSGNYDDPGKPTPKRVPTKKKKK